MNGKSAGKSAVTAVYQANNFTGDVKSAGKWRNTFTANMKGMGTDNEKRKVVKRALIELLIYISVLVSLYGVCYGLCRAYGGEAWETWKELENEMHDTEQPDG